MKAYINEVEIQLGETEKETLEYAAKVAESEVVIQNHVTPSQIRGWLNKVNLALTEHEKERRNDLNESDRFDLLRLRQDLKEVVKGVSQADEQFDEAY